MGVLAVICGMLISGAVTEAVDNDRNSEVSQSSGSIETSIDYLPGATWTWVLTAGNSSDLNLLYINVTGGSIPVPSTCSEAALQLPDRTRFCGEEFTGLIGKCLVYIIGDKETPNSCYDGCTNAASNISSPALIQFNSTKGVRANFSLDFMFKGCSTNTATSTVTESMSEHDPTSHASGNFSGTTSAAEHGGAPLKTDDIALIVIGAVVLLLLFVAVFGYVYWRKRRKNQQNGQNNPHANPAFENGSGKTKGGSQAQVSNRYTPEPEAARREVIASAESVQQVTPEDEDGYVTPINYNITMKSGYEDVDHGPAGHVPSFRKASEGLAYEDVEIDTEHEGDSRKVSEGFAAYCNVEIDTGVNHVTETSQAYDDIEIDTASGSADKKKALREEDTYVDMNGKNQPEGPKYELWG